MSFCILLALPVAANALQPQFAFVRYDNGKIVTSVALADSIPEQVLKYMNKGVPVAIEYAVELWKEKSEWFDSRTGHADVIYKVRYDSWEKRYAVVRISEGLVIEHSLNREREAIDLLTSSGRIKFAADDTGGHYYLRAQATIKTMSFSNYKEVESWLRGGISDARPPSLEEAPDKVGEFIFNMALKVSGISDMTGQAKTAPFKLQNLPTP